MSASEHVSGAIILLLAAAVAVAIVAHRFRVPYTVALVVAGVGLGMTHVLHPPELTQGLLYSVFLPGLLFEAAYHIDWRDVRRNGWAIGALAVPGVAVSAVTTAGLITVASRHVGGVPQVAWNAGLVFGVLIAATDPVAVVALFRRLGVPARLRVLVESESLLNDGTAIVGLTLVLAVVRGSAVSASSLGMSFGATVGGGVLVGGIIGGLASVVIRGLNEPVLEITVTSVAAYGAFLTAETLHGSGVLATVTAGLLCGSYTASRGMSPATRQAVESFWDYVAFALNSLVFLLLGFAVSGQGLLHAWPLIALAYVSVLAARSVVVLGVSAMLDRSPERVPRRWRPVLIWGGLRGALSLVLALGLPPDVPDRAAILTMTLGVVIVSILLQGLTMTPLLRVLKVTNAPETHSA